MDTLGKIRSSFLNKNNFKVGFSNRSPLNQYKSSMPTGFDLPKLEGGKVGIGTRIAEGDNTISNAKLANAETINQSIVGAADEIVQAIDKKQKAKKAEKEKQKLEEEKANIERSEEARNEKKRNELTGQIKDALNLFPN